MANINTRDAIGAVVAGALPVALSRYGAKVPVIGQYLHQYAAPAAGVIAVGAHLLANARQADQYGTEGLAYGGIATLGNYATNWLMTNMLHAPAYAEARARISSDIDWNQGSQSIPGPNAAGSVRAQAPASSTMRIDM